MRRLAVALALTLAAATAWPQREERLGPVDTLFAEPDDLNFAVTAENAAGSQLVLQGTVTTTRTMPVAVHHGSCALRIRLYRSSTRVGAAVWDSAADGISDGHGGRLVCTDELRMARVSRSAQLSPRAMAMVLSANSFGDEVPDATYYATASIVLIEPRMESSEMPAGTLVVRRQ